MTKKPRKTQEQVRNEGRLETLKRIRRFIDGEIQEVESQEHGERFARPEREAPFGVKP